MSPLQKVTKRSRVTVSVYWIFFVLVVCHQDMPYKVTSVRWEETFFVDHSCSLTSILYYLWCHNKWSYVNWHLDQLIWFYLIPNPGHHGPELNIKNITSFWVILFQTLKLIFYEYTHFNGFTSSSIGFGRNWRKYLSVSGSVLAEKIRGCFV